MGGGSNRTSKEKLAKMTPVLLICFGILYSLLGFDLVMALDPHWYSTLFGWMYCPSRIFRCARDYYNSCLLVD